MVITTGDLTAEGTHDGFKDGRRRGSRNPCQTQRFFHDDDQNADGIYATTTATEHMTVTRVAARGSMNWQRGKPFVPSLSSRPEARALVLNLDCFQSVINQAAFCWAATYQRKG